MGVADMKARMLQRMAGQKQGRYGGRDFHKFDDNNVSQADSKGKVQGTVVKEVSIPYGGLSVRNLASKLSMRIDELKAKLQVQWTLENYKKAERVRAYEASFAQRKQQDTVKQTANIKHTYDMRVKAGQDVAEQQRRGISQLEQVEQ